MDPYHHQNPEVLQQLLHLQTFHPLSEIKEMLIARHLPIMKVYNLKGRSGNRGFSGNVINILKDIDELVSILPRTLTEISCLIVRRTYTTSDGTDEFRDFNIKQLSVYAWLQFLQRYNPAYQDIQIRQITYPSKIRSELSIGNENVEDDSMLGPNAGPQHLLEDDEDQVLTTGAAAHQPNEINAQEIIRSIHWPNQDGLPLDEYNLPYLLTRSWPTLIPFGRGDVTNTTHRRIDVSLHDAAQHYQNYCTTVNGQFFYPFASNHRLMFYLHDIDTRHRIQSACSVYLKQTPADANKTIADLQAMADRNNASPEAFSFQKRMQRYAANILGTPSYMAERKSELTALIAEKGMPSVWFTLSLANYYWCDMHNIRRSTITK